MRDFDTEVGWCFFSSPKVDFFFLKKQKKHVKHDRLLCSYLVLIFFLWDCRAVFFFKERKKNHKKQLVLGLFKWIDGARFRLFSLRKKKKKEKERTLKQSPAVVIFFVKLQDSDATSNLCWTLYTHTYTHAFSSIQDQNSLMSDDSYREILTDLFLFSILWALFSTCIQMPFYIGCCIYIPGQAFFFYYYFYFKRCVPFFFFLISCSHDPVFFLFVSMSASVTFPSQAKG